MPGAPEGVVPIADGSKVGSSRAGFSGKPGPPPVPPAAADGGMGSRGTRLW